ncbi:hypothetical protein I553_10772 [Mycobacterium xenopi 4042]|uniref:Uncharacterized protein n=1 Tax=Mycobacterium xenopi 4042 TaxID=1299334 RepID=X8DD99_MYCXE|nr:hypothetical protein I553_10772 [Mycobacterium xenopi 4042]
MRAYQLSRTSGDRRFGGGKPVGVAGLLQGSSSVIAAGLRADRPEILSVT